VLLVLQAGWVEILTYNMKVQLPHGWNLQKPNT
jgi:hypothetical protein